MPDDNFAPMLDDIPEPDDNGSEDDPTDEREGEAEVDIRERGAHSERVGGAAEFRAGDAQPAPEPPDSKPDDSEPDDSKPGESGTDTSKPDESGRKDR